MVLFHILYPFLLEKSVSFIGFTAFLLEKQSFIFKIIENQSLSSTDFTNVLKKIKIVTSR
jgi:hypothetical protein